MLTFKDVRSILQEGLSSDVNKIVDELNAKMSEIAGTKIGMYSTRSSNRMWTRGDGSKYKDPSYIHAAEETYIFNKYPEVKKKFKSTVNLNNFAMDYIKSLPGVKPIGKIKGEFGGSDYNEAYQMGSTIFIKTDFTIKFATKSILKNVDVWKKQ